MGRKPRFQLFKDLQKEVHSPDKLREKEGPSDPDFSFGQFDSKKEGNPWFGFKLNHTTNQFLIEFLMFCCIRGAQRRQDPETIGVLMGQFQEAQFPIRIYCDDATNKKKAEQWKQRVMYICLNIFVNGNHGKPLETRVRGSPSEPNLLGMIPIVVTENPQEFPPIPQVPSVAQAAP